MKRDKWLWLTISGVIIAFTVLYIIITQPGYCDRTCRYYREKHDRIVQCIRDYEWTTLECIKYAGG